MQLFIYVKQLGKRRSVIDQKAITLNPAPQTTGELIASIVALQVQEYNKRLNESDLLNYLTDEHLKEKALTGKIDFGVNYNGMSADTEKAVRNALLSFEDGIFRVFINDTELVSTEEAICLEEGATLTFVRLTMLAGRIW